MANFKYKNQEFSVTYTSINTYVDQNASGFIPSVIGKIKTLDYVTPVLDVKTSKVMPVSKHTFDFVDGDACSTIANSATSSLVGVTLTSKRLKTEETFCLQDIEKYFPEWCKRGSDLQDLPLEGAFIAEKEKAVAKSIDKIFWLGNPLITGMIATATASGCIGLTAQGFGVSTGWTDGILKTIDNMCASLDADVRSEEDEVIFVGTEIFDNYVLSIRNVNNYHLDPADVKNYETRVAGKPNVKLVGTSGLNGSNLAFMHKMEWTFFGTDIMPDEESIMAWFDKSLDKYCLRYRAKIAVALANPTYAAVATSRNTL
ncbi:MAG: hypothetical protein BGO69_15875 [Bacteroidetes bacterium 46-16]|nr:MAG: hypothetical protein BGO69_15875 [Bacteroidetes bacterium 46-16]